MVPFEAAPFILSTFVICQIKERQFCPKTEQNQQDKKKG